MTGKHTKRRKIVGSVFLLGVVLYGVSLLWLVPTLLKAPINEQLKQNNLHIDYQRLWINPLTLNIHLNQVELNNLSGQEVLSAEKIDVDWQLWPLIKRHINIDHLFLKQAEIYLEFNQNNQLISPTFETTSTSSNPWQFNPGTIEVIDSSVVLKKQDQRLPFNDINLQLNLAELINPQKTSPNQHLSIHFKTKPKGDILIERSVDDDFFQWQLNNWPMQQIAPWLSNTQSDIALAGQLSASGSLQWPPEQLPIIQIAETDVTINEFNWPPYHAQQAEMSARNILLDFNTQQVHIDHLSSPAGNLLIRLDPLEITNTFNQRQTAEGDWQTQLNSMRLTNWTITLQDNRPAVKADIEKITIQTESQQQNLTVQFKITDPFDQPIQINAHGQVSPLQLQGEIKADELALETLNPWLQVLSPWQLQQATLSVNSQFCLQDEGIFAKGDWFIAQLSINDGNRRIETTQTSLKSIGLYFNQSLITLNNINNQSLEMSHLAMNTNSPTMDNINNAPQATEQLWRVVIDGQDKRFCEIKPL